MQWVQKMGNQRLVLQPNNHQKYMHMVRTFTRDQISQDTNYTIWSVGWDWIGLGRRG
jgi:hypothetical protein